MPAIRVNKNKDYTVISNYHLKDKRLSLKAKGLLSIMLSLSDEWHYSIAGLVAISKENETAITSTLKELKKYGYLIVRKKLPNETESGRFEYEYNIYEQPQEKQAIEKQGIEILPLEFQGLENQGESNTKGLNTDLLNTNKLSINERGVEPPPPPSPEQIIQLYNEVCPSLSPVQFITDDRIEAIQKALSQYTIEQIRRCFELANSTAFLKGDNDRKWKASFDWLINVDNIAKVLEGNFADNRVRYGNFDTEDAFQRAVERSYGELLEDSDPPNT